MSCAVTSAGAAKCWGANDLGQLGDGTTTPRLTPVGVSGLTSGAAAIATVKDHTCVLTIAGGMKCWGLNINGELGDGTTTQRLTPVDVSGLTSGVAAMAVGFEHTCALTTAGGMKCWGLNNDGQLGDGTRIPRSTPVDVFGLPAGVAAIAPGYFHSCALTNAGAIKCWGENARGELGDGTTTGRLTPVDVSGSFYRQCPTLIPAPHTSFTLADGYAINKHDPRSRGWERITDAMKERGLRSPWDPEWSRLGASHSYTQEVGRPLWIDSTSGSTFIVAGR
jgi:alpha-tubulin suppressor-like RCC1 family protein